ncbi:MAG TPA: superoxide dismutase family protein [Pseudomonadota bacterium]|nr:superoxide dismutase family protein [Pseudomonadota bacterium]
MSVSREAILTLAIGMLGAAGCGDKVSTATATLLSPTGASVGSVTISQTGSAQQVQVTLALTGLPAGKHGAHLHDVGKCDAPDFMTAGGHFNPTSQSHGDPNQSAHHSGDFGNIDVGTDGTGALSITTTTLSLSADQATYAANRAFIIHQNPDDLVTQPTGNSGARIACGIIPVPSGG